MGVLMNAPTGTIEQDNSRNTCHGELLLEQVVIGQPDKLCNIVREILWGGVDYLIYRTDKGVFVHFSDCAKREKEQRVAFTEICPELCELRFLTQGMRGKHGPWWRRLRAQNGDQALDDRAAASLFDHNIAQALMLLMEGKPQEAKSIAEAALEMAVKRSTTDNTIRYVGAAMAAALVTSVAVVIAGYAAYGPYPDTLLYFVAAFFGVLGAAFSVATRIWSFEAKPCQQSRMNYVMARLRIGIGLVSALILYLLTHHSLGGVVIRPEIVQGPEGAALIGFLAGFAERLVPNVFRRTAEAFEESSGTPVQLAKGRTGPTTVEAPLAPATAI